MDSNSRSHGKQQLRDTHLAPTEKPNDASQARSRNSMRITAEWEREENGTENATTTRRRSVSNGVLARFFTRAVEHEDSDKPDQDGLATESFVPRIKTSMGENDAAHKLAEDRQDAGRVSPIKQRKRKGSLRKIALLGGRKASGEGREKKDMLVKSKAEQNTASAEQADHEDELHSIRAEPSDGPTDQTATVPTPSMEGDAPAVATARIHLLADSINSTQQSGNATRPASSASDPKSTNSYASTTEDDDDGLSFSRPSTSEVSVVSSEAIYPPPLPVPSAASYFPSTIRDIRSRSQHRVRPSPLQHAVAPAPEAYSYAETEYWGWVLLFVTWLSFTVGMGSCLDIWSWAWDVGETPYAPPELEDDPTLPIVGYYPALIVLTGVVAWVWITVAWIGMKYFRHAKIEV